MAVSYDKSRNKFKAVVYHAGRPEYLGRFDTRYQAKVAELKAKDSIPTFWESNDEHDFSDIPQYEFPNFRDKVKRVWEKLWEKLR